MEVPRCPVLAHVGGRVVRAGWYGRAAASASAVVVSARWWGAASLHPTGNLRATGSSFRGVGYLHGVGVTHENVERPSFWSALGPTDHGLITPAPIPLGVRGCAATPRYQGRQQASRTAKRRLWAFVHYAAADPLLIHSSSSAREKSRRLPSRWTGILTALVRL